MRTALVSAIDSAAVDLLEARHDVTHAVGLTADELERAVADREVLVARSGVTITGDLMRRAPGLKLVVRAGSGLDNLDVDYMRERGIRLVRVPGPGARAVAEMTFGLILAVGRRIVEADRLLRQGRWPKHELSGRLLEECVLGVVGAGSIGSTVGRLGAAWGMRVIGCDVAAAEGFRARLAGLGIELAEFGDVVGGADIVSLHVPLLASTRHLVDGGVLARMKRGSILVNIARGGVVDEDALYDALASGHLAGAALDVHEREGEGIVPRLADLPNVVLTPHIGAMAIESQRLIGARVVEIIEAFEQGDLDGCVRSGELVL
jgi:D-3-phosphoglycerate dehydrogenase / 2-oxoglutarate reductase